MEKKDRGERRDEMKEGKKEDRKEGKSVKDMKNEVNEAVKNQGAQEGRIEQWILQETKDNKVVDNRRKKELQKERSEK